MLLDAMQADQKHDLYFVTALIGLYGLRLAEIAVLTVRMGTFYAAILLKEIETLRRTQSLHLGKLWD